jgi:hypothetical protein
MPPWCGKEQTRFTGRYGIDLATEGILGATLHCNDCTNDSYVWVCFTGSRIRVGVTENPHVQWAVHDPLLLGGTR